MKILFVFPNGWVASVLKKEYWHSFNGNYSVAVCDYNGYFDWDILEMFGAVNGAVICDTEDEVCEILIREPRTLVTLVMS